MWGSQTVEPQPAGPTFARSARVNGTCTTYERIYIYIYKYIYIYIKNIYIYIYIYDEDFSPLYDKCGARSARQLKLRAQHHVYKRCILYNIRRTYTRVSITRENTNIPPSG